MPRCLKALHRRPMPDLIANREPVAMKKPEIGPDRNGGSQGAPEDTGPARRPVFEQVGQHRLAYTLDELLAQCDFDEPYSPEQRAWLDTMPVGRELL